MLSKVSGITFHIHVHDSESKFSDSVKNNLSWASEQVQFVFNFLTKLVLLFLLIYDSSNSLRKKKTPSGLFLTFAKSKGTSIYVTCTNGTSRIEDTSWHCKLATHFLVGFIVVYDTSSNYHKKEFYCFGCIYLTKRLYPKPIF